MYIKALVHLKQSSYRYLASFVLIPRSLGFSNANVSTVVLSFAALEMQQRIGCGQNAWFLLFSKRFWAPGVYPSLLSKYGGTFGKRCWYFNKKSHCDPFHQGPHWCTWWGLSKSFVHYNKFVWNNFYNHFKMHKPSLFSLHHPHFVLPSLSPFSVITLVISWGVLCLLLPFAQSCPTLCNPMDSSLPGSAIHGIFQARILEWAVISFSRGSSQPRDGTRVSCIADRCWWSEPPGKQREGRE